MAQDIIQPDEARRLAQHQGIKSELREDVNRDVAREARARVNENGEVQKLGAELERHAVREVADTEREVQKGRVVARVAQVLDYVFFTIYGLIAVEIILDLTGARQGNTFKRAIDLVSSPFLAPFRGLFHDPAIGQFRIMFSYVAALVAWLLFHLALRGLLRLIGSRQTQL